MSTEIVQALLEIVMTKLLPYVLPVLFIFAAALFSERLIDMIVNAVTSQTRKRR